MESTYNFHIWEEDELPDYNVDDIIPNTQYFFINLYFRLVSEEYSQTTFLVSSNDLFNKTTTIMDNMFSDAPDFMDPATKSSIQALKKVKIDGSCTSSDQ
ncbi:hypothetical protein SO802_021585 [Lithocarpus litseifolius]|uniref:Uncharacterized protein n=1 Tax=Lithocarpus litseifolius TaxID=425828 RepID=A0AAW2CI81_9ROSI